MSQAIDVNRKSRGRPRVDAILVGVRIPPDMIAAIDEFIGEMYKMKNRPEAVRFIVRDWLKLNGRL